MAKALKEKGAAKVFLYVTHGQFNYGFDELKESINHVYCTNSYRDVEDQFVTQFKFVKREYTGVRLPDGLITGHFKSCK